VWAKIMDLHQKKNNELRDFQHNAFMIFSHTAIWNLLFFGGNERSLQPPGLTNSAHSLQSHQRTPRGKQLVEIVNLDVSLFANYLGSFKSMLIVFINSNLSI
jgi:hypothetical protein